VAVIVFPGTWSERDFVAGAAILDWEITLVWHTETELGEMDALVLPGGFAHGDHLRTGAIARFSPAMSLVIERAERGVPVIGSCNGFQILTEAGLLPGALMRNDHLEYRCAWQDLRVEVTQGPWLSALSPGEVIRLPISHGEGRFVADDATLDRLEANDLVALRYAEPDGRITPDANPNGSARGIAGIVNPAGTILGLMPHPERALESEVGGTDGLRLLRSLDTWLRAQPAAAERRNLTTADMGRTGDD
jgi:phosphoribosylformylglycinamidine synthase